MVHIFILKENQDERNTLEMLWTKYDDQIFEETLHKYDTITK